MCDKTDLNKNLLRAVKAQNLEEVKYFISAGADVNLIDTGHGDKETLLHCTNSVEIVKELLLRGAMVDIRNSYAETPLDTAIARGKDLEFVQELLKHGALVNTTNRRGNTPINLATTKHEMRLEIIEELLKYGADVTIRNREESRYQNCHSPLENAVRYSIPRAKLLIKYSIIRYFECGYEKILNFDRYRDIYTTYLSKYYNDCVCEVSKMKTDEIMTGLPLYNCVRNNFNRQLLTNYSLSLRLSNIDFSKNYPIYNGIISDRIKPFLKRADLLRKLKLIHIYTLNPDKNGINIILDPYSIPFITEYLTDDELLKLIIASETCDVQLVESDTEQVEGSASGTVSIP